MEKEKNPYMISIVGEQKVEGQDDRIEVITEGKYMMKNGHFLINYKEYDCLLYTSPSPRDTR